MWKLLSKMDNVLSERKIRKKLSIIVVIIIMSFLLFVGNAKAYNIEGNGICNCSNCDDCNDALYDDNDCYNEVKLTNNISHHNGDCIYFEIGRAHV